VHIVHDEIESNLPSPRNMVSRRPLFLPIHRAQPVHGEKYDESNREPDSALAKLVCLVCGMFCILRMKTFERIWIDPLNHAQR